MKRIFTLLLACLLLLTACTTGGIQSEFDVEIYSEGEELSGTLTIAVDEAEIEYFGWYSLVQGFKTLHPNVEVIAEHTNVNVFEQEYEQDQIELEKFREDLKVNLLGGEAPDLILSSLSDYATNFASSNMIYNLNEFIENDESFKEEDFFMEILQAFEVMGGLYTMPNTVSFSMMRLRTDVLDEANIDYSALESIDYKLLLNAYNGAKESGNFPELKSMGLNAVDGHAVFFGYESGSCIDYGTLSANFNTPEYIEYLTLTKEYDGSTAPVGVFMNSETTDDYFLDKSYLAEGVYSSINPLNFDHVMADINDVTPAVPTTSSKGELSLRAGYSMSIPKNCENPALAWEFIKYCTYESESISTGFMEHGKFGGDRFDGWIPINKNNFEKYAKGIYFEEAADQVDAYIKKIEDILSTMPLKSDVSNPYIDSVGGLLWIDYYQTDGIATAEEVAIDMQNRYDIYFSEIK